MNFSLIKLTILEKKQSVVFKLLNFFLWHYFKFYVVFSVNEIQVGDNLKF